MRGRSPDPSPACSSGPIRPLRPSANGEAPVDKTSHFRHEGGLPPGDSRALGVRSLRRFLLRGLGALAVRTTCVPWHLWIGRASWSVQAGRASVAGAVQRRWEWLPLSFLYRPAAMRIGVARE